MTQDTGKKKKIAHVVLSLDVGGLETLVVDLIRGIDRQQFDVMVVCLRHKGVLAEQIESLGFRVESLGNRDKVEIRAFFKLAKLLIAEKIDVVHCHNTAGYLYGGVAAIMAGFKKIVYTEHGRVFPDAPRRMLAERILSWFTYRIVAVSEDMKRCMITYEKINSSKIQVIRNGVDTNKFKRIESGEWRAEKKQELGIGKNDIVIGNVARLDPVKDHATLLKAMALLLIKDKGLRIKDEVRGDEKSSSINHQPSSLKLLLVGDGSERENIESLIRELKLEANCKALGTRTDVSELMNIMDVFVLSSRNEGISLTLLEAMACGVPVVATRVGGNPEIVKDGENGFLANPNDPNDLGAKIVSVLNNSMLDVSCPESLQSMIKKYEVLYGQK